MLTIEHLESRETPSVSLFDTAIPHEYPDGTTVVAAGYGGGPRVDVYRSDQLVAAFFAFESSFRGGVFVDYADGTLYVGAGPGGAPVQVTYSVTDAGVVETDRAFMLGGSDARFGWVPNAPPVIPFTQHPTYPLTDPYILDSYARDLNRIPREIQQQLLDAGLRIVVHSAPHLVFDNDGVPHRTFYVPAERTAYIGYGGGIVHEIGHAYDHLVRGGDGSEEFADRFVNEIYFGVLP